MAIGASNDPGMYGRSFAEVYDEWYADFFDTETAVQALLALAGAGGVLELGVGTGRLALPLARQGIRVVGIDASREMLERLRLLDPDGHVTAIYGDMTNAEGVVRLAQIHDQFTLAFCAFNTLLNLKDEAAVVECLSKTRTLLAPNGRFVIEAFVPIEIDQVPLRSLTPARVSSDAAVFIETSFDPQSLVLNGKHIEVHHGSVTSRPWSVILFDPDHIDAAAESAGLRLIERWSDWTGSSFTEESTTHISIYAPNA